MKTKRIVISGGPGSGKTTLISHLENLGHACMHEISREITLAAQKNGIDQLFLKDPILFSQNLLDGRLKQFQEASATHLPFLFFDRGMPDVTAYMDYLGTKYPSHFSEVCNENRYDLVFLLPPWEAIYAQDNERYESFGQAENIYNFILEGYRKYNYSVCEVPVGSISLRSEFILNKTQSLL